MFIANSTARLETIASIDAAGAGMPRSATGELGFAYSLHASQPLLAAALASMASAIFITDVKGVILWVNHAFTGLSGFSAQEAVGRTPAILHSQEGDRAFCSLLWKTILAGHVWQGDVVNRHATGRLYTVDEIITPLFDQSGLVSHFIAIQHDVTNRQQESERVRHLAFHDGLTGLPNRRSFLSILQSTINKAKDDGSSLALLYVDLDKFKPVNDEFGHHIGDRLLTAVAQRVRSAVRKCDLVARIGGDEFIVLLPSIASSGLACSLAQELIHSLTRQFTIECQRISIGASIGLAFYPRDGSGAEELMIHADRAMYEAKQRGGASYACYTRDRDRRFRH